MQTVNVARLATTRLSGCLGCGRCINNRIEAKSRWLNFSGSIVMATLANSAQCTYKYTLFVELTIHIEPAFVYMSSSFSPALVEVVELVEKLLTVMMFDTFGG